MLSVNTPGTDAPGADKLAEWTCSVVDNLSRRGMTEVHQEEGGAVVGVPATCVAQLVHAPKAPKIPITPELFRRDRYDTDMEYTSTVHSACMYNFSKSKMAREEHVSVAKEYVSKNFAEGDKIHDHVSKLRDVSLSYDTSNFETSKNTLGHYNYTTRFFNHLMKLFFILACLKKSAMSYSWSRKRKLQEALDDDNDHTTAEKDEICSLWGDRCKDKIMDIGMKAVMGAHIEYMNTSGDMQFICAMMIMNEAVFGNESPKYDLSSLLDIAACYDNVCNWFNYMETNKNNSTSFVMEEDLETYNRIMARAIDHPLIPELIRKNYKEFVAIENSSANNKKVLASVIVGRTRKKMLARWNAFTAKFGVAAKVYPNAGGKRPAEPSAVLALTMAP